MKKLVLFSLLYVIAFLGISQTINPKATNYYYNTQIDKKNDITLNAQNIVARYNFAKFKLIIVNDSKNYVMLRKDELKYKNNKGTFSATEKKTPKFVSPFSKHSWTIDFKGNNFFLVDTFTIIPEGIYTFAIDKTKLKAPIFHLPPNKNQFTVGEFTVTMTKLKKVTGLVSISFKAQYAGNKIGIISPSDAVLTLPDGSSWANTKSNMKPKILVKGETASFTLKFEVPGRVIDTQFANLDIDWKTSYRTTNAERLKFKSKEVYLEKTK